MARLLDLEEDKDSEAFLALKDLEDIPQWSAGVVSAVVNKGYMKLRDDGSFDPATPATRAEVIAALDGGYLNFVKASYNEPGTYTGGLIDGSVHINAKDTVLENTIIYGNLTIGEDVGPGDVTLKDVTVKGDTLVKGGGMDTINIEDSEIANLIIEKKDGKVRILAKGTTSIGHVLMSSGGKLESDNGYGSRFRNVLIGENMISNEPIILKGNFESVEVKSGSNQIKVEGGSIKDFVIGKTAKDLGLDLAEGVQVGHIEINAKAHISGKGKIGLAKVNANDVILLVAVDKIERARGIEEPKAPEAETPKPGSGGGGSSGGKVDTKVGVSGINVNPEELTLVVGGRPETITARVNPSNASNKKITWTSSDESVATVLNGLVTPIAKGEAIITATSEDGGFTGTTKVSVVAESPEEDFGFNSETGSIEGYLGSEEDVVIPAEIGGVAVREIGKNAFGNKGLKTMLIPGSVTVIGEGAFYDNELNRVNIPNSVKSIGVAAFNKNQLADNQAFIYARKADGTEDKTRLISYGGAKRDNVVVANSVTAIEEFAFVGNDLTSIVIPNSVITIGPSAFMYNKLTTVSIPSSVLEIAEEAFYGNGEEGKSNNIVKDSEEETFEGRWIVVADGTWVNVESGKLHEVQITGTASSSTDYTIEGPSDLAAVAPGELTIIALEAIVVDFEKLEIGERKTITVTQDMTILIEKYGQGQSSQLIRAVEKIQAKSKEGDVTVDYDTNVIEWARGAINDPDITVELLRVEWGSIEIEDGEKIQGNFPESECRGKVIFILSVGDPVLAKKYVGVVFKVNKK